MVQRVVDRGLPDKRYTEDAAFPEQVVLKPIGVVHSPHTERFGTPHQATVAADPTRRPSEHVTLEFFREQIPPEALHDLAGFDYVWVLSWMHLNRGWNAKVLPPRGPRQKRGLLSTRSPHRPNPIALSAARLLGVEGLRVHVERLDLLDGTPILDIKPYLPYADAFPGAAAGWVDEIPPTQNDPTADRS